MAEEPMEPSTCNKPCGKRGSKKCPLEPGHIGDCKPARGFAAMNKEQHRAMCAKGGRKAQKEGAAHRFTTADASAAGRKGGAVVSQDRAHMSKIGKLGGRARSRRRAAEDQLALLVG